MRILFSIIILSLISFCAHAQNQSDLLGQWAFQKYVVLKSKTMDKKLTSREEWSPKEIDFKKGGKLLTKEISYTDEEEQPIRGKWTLINNQINFNYLYNDGTPQDENGGGELIRIHKLKKKKMILVFPGSYNKYGDESGTGVWEDVYVTYKRKK